MSTPMRDHDSPLSADGTSLALRGRSRMWPIEDSTTKSRPRMPAMVFALAGDSTMTRGFGTGGRMGTPRGGCQAAQAAERGVRTLFPQAEGRLGVSALGDDRREGRDQVVRPVALHD